MVAKVSKKDTTVEQELEQICRKGGGILRPGAVVAFAENPKTVLHSKFEWDDSSAAHQYRLWQAREIIRVSVTYCQPASKTVQAYVSLSEDRNSGGGYRRTIDVLADDDLRDALLSEAKDEMLRFRRKYHDLVELSKVFSVIDELTVA